MRIGIDARLWNESGVGRYIRNLVSELSVLDTKNYYCLFVRDQDAESIKYTVLGIKQKKWKVVATNIRWHSVAEQFEFVKILNRENLDLVHFPYFSVPIFYKKPFIVTIHDLILHHFPTGEASTLPLPVYKIKLAAYKYVISKAAKNACKILTVSNATKDDIVKTLKVQRDKIVVTYEGVEETIQNSKGKSQSASWRTKFKSKRYLLYIGNAYPHKNLNSLLVAFQSLVKEFKDVQLVLVGKEDYFFKKLREKVTSLKLADHVKMLGYVSDSELSNLYKNAIALVAPSKMEGFDLPTVEAMAQRCLVIASDIAVHREICGDSAIYFDPKNSDELVRKMKEVLHYNNTYYQSKKIEPAFARSKKFSWEKMAVQTLEIYESCPSASSG